MSRDTFKAKGSPEPETIICGVDCDCEKSQKLFTDIYSVLVDNNLNIDPLANELGEEIDNFIALVLKYSKGNIDE